MEMEHMDMTAAMPQAPSAPITATDLNMGDMTQNHFFMVLADVVKGVVTQTMQELETAETDEQKEVEEETLSFMIPPENKKDRIVSSGPYLSGIA